ncbi:follistatin-related protein 1-like [Homarus americanus]|uniref:follistatin-related protein 1-like n=1 Tax=Homarus americanus TaxID=6706 RepID=UPI001C48F4A3|nr:follistatin-related protein 1-like [Homarus americanus]
MRLIIVYLAVASATAFDLRGRHDPCDTVECRAGRECVVSEGAAHCQCIQSCPDRYAPVCGSDGTSYDTHCLLHRHACLTGNHIKVVHKGICKKVKQVKKKTVKIEDPAVCYSSQRDALLQVVKKHWQDTLADQPWHVPGMTYRESLWGRFFTCDGDKDNHLNSDEFLNCTIGAFFMARPEQERELTRYRRYEDKEDEHCTDAIVDVADTNRDWRLDFEEFTTMLSPDFHPAHKLCSLDGKQYLDGEDVHVDGNHCICAVGSWVCTSTDTSKDTNKKDFGVQAFDYLDDTENKIDNEDDDSYNDLIDDDYDLSSEDDDDYLIDEEEDEEYLEELFDDLLDKLKRHREQKHHHNYL